MRLFLRFLLELYGVERRSVRNTVLSLIRRFDGGELYSQVLRELFSRYHGVDIGLYTHGGCFCPGRFDKKTAIGRYSSMANTAVAFNRNHPLHYKSIHAFFFNPKLKICRNDVLEYIPLNIGNDVWVGHNAIIMPNVRTIGDGAIIAAGAVVNKDVPPYGIVVGNPARVVRYRFSDKIIQELISSRWWAKPIEDLKNSVTEFQTFPTEP